MLLYTVQPKIDTKGHCYTLALQQILAGIYIAELCLIGLFGLRQAIGPAIMLGILFIVTVLFNATTNRYLAPLENYLPADLALESEEDEEAPLLGSSEQESTSSSHIQRIGNHARVPAQVVDPIARFFEPHVFASHKAMKAWLKEGDFDEDDVPSYKEADVKKAYLNPAYTSPTPVVWLAADEMKVSRNEVSENEKQGLECSDEGAWIDEKGRLKWSEDDFGQVPIFKEKIRW